MTDDWLRFRLYVDRKVHAQVIVFKDFPDSRQRCSEAGAHLKQLSDQADENDQPWCIEIYDPELPPNSAYLRFGTDPRDMHQPRLIELHDPER